MRSAIRHHRGREINTTGDGFLAAFDGPGRAIRCAVEMTHAAGSLGLELRVGVHTGECEVRGQDLAGIAVHIGARVANTAEPGQVLVTGTVRDLVAGSGIDFTDLGTRTLKDVGEWRLLAVDTDASA
jgi:class 3 adenylate cyclase